MDLNHPKIEERSRMQSMHLNFERVGHDVYMNRKSILRSPLRRNALVESTEDLKLELSRQESLQDYLSHFINSTEILQFLYIKYYKQKSSTNLRLY